MRAGRMISAVGLAALVAACAQTMTPSENVERFVGKRSAELEDAYGAPTNVQQVAGGWRYVYLRERAMFPDAPRISGGAATDPGARFEPARPRTETCEAVFSLDNDLIVREARASGDGCARLLPRRR